MTTQQDLTFSQFLSVTLTKIYWPKLEPDKAAKVLERLLVYFFFFVPDSKKFVTLTA